MPDGLVAEELLHGANVHPGHYESVGKCMTQASWRWETVGTTNLNPESR
jgi:hypothetical protein